MAEEQKEQKESKEIEDKSKNAETTEVTPTKKNIGKDELVRILFHEKPMRLLLSLLQDKQWRISTLARESNQSYVYTTKLIKKFRDLGLLTINLNGKKKIIKLTENGEKLTKELQNLITSLV
jgi:predicted transcriptional regulator